MRATSSGCTALRRDAVQREADVRDLDQLVSDLKSAPIPTCSWCARHHHGGPEHCMTGTLLVCGGRDYADRARVFRVLDKAATRIEIRELRHGACGLDADDLWDSSKLRGADRWAHEWATERQVEIDPMAAAWRRYNSRAGPLRNQDMLARGGVVCLIAFPGGRGTEDMVERATRANIPVWRL